MTAPPPPRRQQTVRQQVLVLYLASSALDARVVGWSTYDGTGETAPDHGGQRRPAVRDRAGRAEGRLAAVPGRAAAPAAAGSRVRRVVPQARVLLREARHGVNRPCCIANSAAAALVETPILP